MSNKEAKNKVSRFTFLGGLLIEILVFLLGEFLDAVIVERGLKYLHFIKNGLLAVYFLGRNYLFLSVSSALLGIRWKKTLLIPLKNFLYILIIVLTFLMFLRKMVILTVLAVIAVLALYCDIIYMLFNGKCFLDKCFKIECYSIKKN